MKHPVYDKDPHFSLDIDTRALISTMKKVSLIQGDINSERFTFDLPAEIEGHKLVDCDKVEVHFINIDILTKAESKGFYTIDDLQMHDEDPTKVVCSWLIDGRATKYVGSLSFVIRVTCLDGINVRYAWHTAIHTGITVSDGICCTEATIEQYIDVLAKWKLEIEAGLQQMEAKRVQSVQQTQTSSEDGGTNIWTLTFGDGSKSELVVKNGRRGESGLVGSIETVDGKILNFFCGTSEQYAALTENQKVNLFAIVTDDAADADLQEALTLFRGLADGSVKAKAAETADALSTSMYMTHVRVEGLTSYGSDAEDVKFYFTYIGASKFSGEVTHSKIANDMTYTVPASGFFGKSSRVIAAGKDSTGGGLSTKIATSDGAESERKSTSYTNLKYYAYSQKITGGA